MQSNHKNRLRGLGLLLTIIYFTVGIGYAPSVYADPPEGRKERHEEKHGKKHKEEEKIEYKGDDYKYEYKYKAKGDHYSIKEKYHAGGPPPWAPAHGYRGTAPRPYYGPMGTDIGILGGSCNRQTVGTLLGGVVGGALGSRVGEGTGKTAATIAGTLLGMMVGGNIGRSMDDADRYCLGQVLEQAPDRGLVSWRNPDLQSEYRVTPTRTYEQSGRYCREYTTESIVGGRPQSVYGTACRQPDGSWEIVR